MNDRIEQLSQQNATLKASLESAKSVNASLRARVAELERDLAAAREEAELGDPPFDGADEDDDQDDQG